MRIKEIYRGNTAPKDTDLMWIRGKEILLFSNGGWINVNESTVVDTELNPTSNHPIANSAVAASLSNVEEVTKNCIETTYSELKALRDRGNLVPGMWYRITDYECFTSQKDTRSAGHQFDILVQALDINVLGEECKAIQHEGDTYFANCNLAAWKVWYCLDNDEDKFFWIKGVHSASRIYTDNELWFDFYGTVEIEGQTVYLWWNESFSDVYASENNYTDKLFYLGSYSKFLSVETELNLISYSQNVTPEYDIEKLSYSTVQNVENDGEEVLEGKGVIYRLIDEHNNDCSYDFKNIQFKRYKVTSKNTILQNYKYTDYFDQKFIFTYGCYGDQYNVLLLDYYNTTNEYRWFYTFSAVRAFWDDDEIIIPDFSDDEIIIEDFSIKDVTGFYNENTAVCGCYNNYIGKFYHCGDEYEMHHYLSNNIFLGWCVDLNTLPENYKELYGDYIFDMASACYDNYLGEECINNTCLKDCYKNKFNDKCSLNILGQSCYDNIFNYFEENILEERAHSNVFELYSLQNLIKSSFEYNIISGEFRYNFVYGWVSSNIFEMDCISNIFGQTITNSRFVDLSGCILGSQLFLNPNYLLANMRDINMFHNKKILVHSSQTATLMNVYIYKGVNDPSNNLVNLNITYNSKHTIFVDRDTNGNVKKWTPADLVP